MKNITLLFLMLLVTMSSFSQKDSLTIGDKYWEDQLYVDITYNLLVSQPKELNSTGFSYGLALGYIKDIPFNKGGKTALGIGVGYSYDLFNHNLKVIQNNDYQVGSDISSNQIKLHNLEIPLQVRWRSSDANTYSFWRLYAGVKVLYNLSNNFSYTTSTNDNVGFSNIPKYNPWQTGLSLSAGYGTFNFHAFYGLSPMFKGATLNDKAINSKIVRLGLSFYLL